MTNITSLETDRLVLRQWQKSDLPHFADINADPEVMEFFPKKLSKIESDGMANKIIDLIYDQGWGLWAVEEKSSNQFIGFVGLHKPTANLPCTPCVEIGWRLEKNAWGKGYATEAAKVALKFAFEKLKLAEVFAFTSITNKKSYRVMQRIGMTDMQQNFEHPIFPEGHPLIEHVLYKISLPQWQLINSPVSKTN